MTSIDSWPSLRYENWNDTIDSLHIGKVKLALKPFLNQWWHVAFYLNMKGMTTGLIPYEETYDIGSKAAKWDIESLKAEIPV